MSAEIAERTSGARVLRSVHRPLRYRRDGDGWQIHTSGPRSDPPHRRCNLRQGPRGSRTRLSQRQAEATAASNTAERRRRSRMGGNFLGCGARSDRRGHAAYRRAAWTGGGRVQSIVAFDDRHCGFRCVRCQTDECLRHAQPWCRRSNCAAGDAALRRATSSASAALRPEVLAARWQTLPNRAA